MSLTATATPRTLAGPRELVRALRPRQWTKNLLVYAAPMAGGYLRHPRVDLAGGLAFVLFTAASAGGYLLNDVLDVERDRAHPTKRLRPVAAGTLGTRTAVLWAVGLIAAAATGSALLDDELLPLVVGYSALTLGYAIRLKGVPWLELLVVASGFVLRPLAGAAAGGIVPSAWFLAVCCAAAVLVTAGKRLVELTVLGPAAAAHRPVLEHYTRSGLVRVQVVGAVALGAAYVGWAFARHAGPGQVVALTSLAPLLFGSVRVIGLNGQGRGGAPEDLLLGDRPLQVAALVWLVLFVATVTSG
jgi:decaprenyl-phosphate phosphoribosyltransferase